MTLPALFRADMPTGPAETSWCRKEALAIHPPRYAVRADVPRNFWKKKINITYDVEVQDTETLNHNYFFILLTYTMST